MMSNPNSIAVANDTDFAFLGGKSVMQLSSLHQNQSYIRRRNIRRKVDLIDTVVLKGAIRQILIMHLSHVSLHHLIISPATKTH